MRKKDQSHVPEARRNAPSAAIAPAHPSDRDAPLLQVRNAAVHLLLGRRGAGHRLRRVRGRSPRPVS